MPRWAWVAGTVLAALAAPAPAGAQPLPPPDLPARRAADPGPSLLEAPVAVAGFPVRTALEPIRTATEPIRTAPDPTPVPQAPAEAPRPVRPALGAPSVAGGEPVGAVVPAGAAEAVRAARPDAPPPADPVNDFLTRRAGPPTDKAAKADRDPGRHTSGAFGDRVRDIIGNRGEWGRSDSVFCGFVSPVTNPFLFEDPRSLTEARLIYLHQRIPGSQADTGGGSINYFGLQARVAITNRLSFTINKLGGTWFSPSNDAVLPDSVGFSEVWLGPKFTFIRNEESGSLLAGGVQFQIPVGSASVYQNTGSLSIVPYATYAQKFFKDAGLGSVNTMANVAYAFSTTGARSDYLSLSGHVDWDVLHNNHFFPLFELNYTLVTTDGTTRPLVGSEGRDLFNLGAAAKGHGLLTGAVGARYKFTESVQLGAAYEFPIAGPRDFFQSRFIVDFILRY